MSSDFPKTLKSIGDNLSLIGHLLDIGYVNCQHNDNGILSWLDPREQASH